MELQGSESKRQFNTITVNPHGSIPLERQLRSVKETPVAKKSLRQLNGGARHPMDLRARRSFEHDGCS